MTRKSFGAPANRQVDAARREQDNGSNGGLELQGGRSTQSTATPDVAPEETFAQPQLKWLSR